MSRYKPVAWLQFICAARVAIVLLVVLLLNGKPGLGQEKPTFNELDSLTYIQYQNGQWNELIKTGNQALSAGFDYYYLRMRMGIAWFMLERYRLAANHFERALSFNSADPVAFGYLQKCYAWSGMETEAAYMNKRFPYAAKSTGEKNQIIRDAIFLTGFSFSESDNKLPGLNLSGDAGIYGEVNLSGNMFFMHAGINYSPRPDLLWFLGFTNTQLAKHQRIVAVGLDTINRSYTLLQNQVYASVPVHLAKGWQIAPALNLVRITDRPVMVSYDTLNLRYIVDTASSSQTNYVASLKAMKNLTYLGLGASFGFSHMPVSDQLQMSFEINTYPFANLNLYTFSRVSAIYINGRFYNHFKQTIGGRIINWLWLQGSFHGGELKAAHDENGLLFFNTAGKIISRSTATAYILSGDKFVIRIEYSFVKQRDDYLQFIDFVNYTLNPVHYNNHQIMGGIKWNL